MKSSQPHILLLGGGYCLSALAKELSTPSFIITSRRDTTVCDFRTQGYQSEVVDISNLRSLSALLEAFPSIRVLVDSVPPPCDAVEELAAIYGPYFEVLESHTIERALFLSSTGVYGRQNGCWVDEQSVLEPKSVSARKRIVAEEYYQKSTIPSCCLRLSGIYGPGRGIATALRKGVYQLIQDEQRWSNRIHVDDIVSILKLLIQADGEVPEFLNISDDKPTLLSEVVNYYCSKFNLPAPRYITRQEAEGQGRVRLLGNQRVSNKLLHSTLDYDLKFPDYSFDLAGS